MTSEEIKREVERVAKAAKQASVGLAQMSGDARDEALCAMAAALRERADEIVEANAADMDAARAAGTKESLLDRLMLDHARVEGMAAALEELAELPDPLGRVEQHRTLYNGIDLTRVSVPLGVAAVVYEARPNVTADAAGICVKSGNACVLRGGSMAAASNAAIAWVLAEAAEHAGVPAGAIGCIASTDRAATDELMQLHGIVDVLIPRGGAGLISHCVECSKVPVIETGTGNCHVYVHESADPAMARAIVVNAKCRRFGVCNAAETLLVDRAAAERFLPDTLVELARRGVVAHCDEEALRCVELASAAASAQGVDLRAVPATEEDWATEYLAPEIAVHCVEGPPMRSPTSTAMGRTTPRRLSPTRTIRRVLPPSRRSSRRSMRRRSMPTPRRRSPTAGSSGSAPRSASPRRRCTCAGPSPPRRSRRTSTCCAATGR